jgi:hypothetical protein
MKSIFKRRRDFCNGKMRMLKIFSFTKAKKNSEKINILRPWKLTKAYSKPKSVNSTITTKSWISVTVASVVLFPLPPLGLMATLKNSHPAHSVAIKPEA